MKSFFVAALFVTIAVASVMGEPCTSNLACHQHGITTCGGHTHVVCNNNQCECTNGPNGATCTTQADCTNTCQNQHHNQPHCVDGHCHCSRPNN